ETRAIRLLPPASGSPGSVFVLVLSAPEGAVMGSLRPQGRRSVAPQLIEAIAAFALRRSLACPLEQPEYGLGVLRVNPDRGGSALCGERDGEVVAQGAVLDGDAAKLLHRRGKINRPRFEGREVAGQRTVSYRAGAVRAAPQHPAVRRVDREFLEFRRLVLAAA